MRVGYAQNAKTQRGSTDQSGLAITRCIPTVLDEGIHEPAAYDQLAERSAEPRNSRVEDRVRQVDVMGVEKISRKPGQQQIKNIVVGTVAESEPDDFGLLQKISQRC